MGRRRKGGNPLGLEKRVYWHHGQFIYRHRNGAVDQLGTDAKKANERAKLYNDPDGRYGTIAYFLNLYNSESQAGRLLKRKKPRTIADNLKEAEYLKVALGNYFPQDLVDDPSLISGYRNNRVAKVRANRELSLLSAMYTWLIESGLCPGLNTNPVLGIQRNPEKAKERYVEDAEYRGVYGIAQRSVCMAMELAYATLQRPEDILSMELSSVRAKSVAGRSTRVLSVTQGKTDRTVDIEIGPELEVTLKALTGGKVPRLSKYLAHNLGGGKYTVDGIGAMIRRYCKKAAMKSFGLMDVRAKGATDMYLRGVPLETIQALMGHKSVQTTEIYIKKLLATISIAQPNTVKVAS